MFQQTKTDALPSDAAPNDMKNSALQSRSPVRARGSGRRGRYKIPLTVPSLPIFDHTPEEVARYTRAGFVPFSSSVTPYAHSAPDSSSASIQELDGHAANLTMINGLDDFRIVNSHVICEQDGSAAISIASSIQELHGGMTNSHVVSGRQDGSASLSIASSIHGSSAHQDSAYYPPNLQLDLRTAVVPNVTGDPVLVRSPVPHATASLASPVLGLGEDFTGSTLSDIDDLQWPDAGTLKLSEQTADSIQDSEFLVGIQSAQQLINVASGSTGCVAAENAVLTNNFDQWPSIEERPEEHSDPVIFLESLWNLHKKMKAKNTEPSLF